LRALATPARLSTRFEAAPSGICLDDENAGAD